MLAWVSASSVWPSAASPDTDTRLQAARVHGLDEKLLLGRGHGAVVRGEDISQGAVYEVFLRLGPVPN